MSEIAVGIFPCAGCKRSIYLPSALFAFAKQGRTARTNEALSCECLNTSLHTLGRGRGRARVLCTCVCT